MKNMYPTAAAERSSIQEAREERLPPRPSAEKVRSSQVANTLESLMSLLDCQEKLIQSLRDRLKPVLRNEAAEKEKDGLVENSMVPLADAIRMMSRRVSNSNDQLELLIVLLEL